MKVAVEKTKTEIKNVEGKRVVGSLRSGMFIEQLISQKRVCVRLFCREVGTTFYFPPFIPAV